MEILITICARGGSKGIPGKNIKLLNGIPLLAYTITTAGYYSKLRKADIALSTDSDEILKVAGDHGLVTGYHRPAILAGDRAGKIGVIADLLAYEEKTRGKSYDYIIDLDVTSPLRTAEDIDRAFMMLTSSPAALNIFSVSPASRNPYFNMVEKGTDGFVHTVKDGTVYLSRQEAPQVFDINASFYIYRKSFFSAGYTSAVTERSLAYVMPHTCFDLDEPSDFTVMGLMLREGLLDFEL